MDEPTPEQRAARAAEQLDAEGAAVTARAVRDKAGVRTQVAAAAAKAWSARKAETRRAPDPPPSVTARFEAIWREAHNAASAAFDTERDTWAQRLSAAQTERDALAEDLDKTETQNDALTAKAARLEADLAAARADADDQAERLRRELDQARAQTAEAEQRRAAAEGLTTGLREALAAITPRQPDD
jgi:chromosome segregation ATPase